MEKRIKGKEIGRAFKVLGLAYVISAAMLLALAYLVFRFGISETVVSIGIVLVYIVSCLAAGFLMGKLQKSRKFLWGLFMGAMYFVVLLILTGFCGKDVSDVATDFGYTMFLCLGSGMLGGMVS